MAQNKQKFQISAFQADNRLLTYIFAYLFTGIACVNRD